MVIKNNQITVHKCIFEEQARKVKDAIKDITQKDSLSAGDTQAIRKLSEVYDVLSNPVQETNIEKAQTSERYSKQEPKCPF